MHPVFLPFGHRVNRNISHNHLGSFPTQNWGIFPSYGWGNAVARHRLTDRLRKRSIQALVVSPARLSLHSDTNNLPWTTKNPLSFTEAGLLDFPGLYQTIIWPGYCRQGKSKYLNLALDLSHHYLCRRNFERH
jgi:hypothetical protein